MPRLISLLIFFFSLQLQAQIALPAFLAGTWKVANKESYEHWDNTGGTALKGLSYKMVNGRVQVTEYLEMSFAKEHVFYYATVPSQNNGMSIPFKLVQADSNFVFENNEHDFPNRITYQPVDSITIKVTVSGNQQKGFAFIMYKQSGRGSNPLEAAANSTYDAALAKEMGADEYGMKGYILVLLKTGTNASTDKQLISESFKGHMENINRLVEAGKLIVAGPMGKNEQQYRGIFILQDVGTLQEARALLQTDPAIKANLLAVELYNWYGSAALPAYLPLSEKISKLKP